MTHTTHNQLNNETLENGVVLFTNAHGLYFNVWKDGQRVVLQRVTGEKTMSFESLETAVQYANMVGRVLRRETFVFGD